MEYSAEVQRRLRSPHRAGFSSESGSRRVTGEAEDRSLNVWVRFEVQLADGEIDAVRFQAYGCPHFVAAADLYAERLEESADASLSDPGTEAVREMLDVPIEKLGKLLVIEDALAACAHRVGQAGGQGIELHGCWKGMVR